MQRMSGNIIQISCTFVGENTNFSRTSIHSIHFSRIWCPMLTDFLNKVCQFRWGACIRMAL